MTELFELKLHQDNIDKLINLENNILQNIIIYLLNIINFKKK